MASTTVLVKAAAADIIAEDDSAQNSTQQASISSMAAVVTSMNNDHWHRRNWKKVTAAYVVTRMCWSSQHHMPMLWLRLLMSATRDVAYRGFWLVPWLDSKSPQDQQAVVQKTLDLMAQGIMSPPIGEFQ